MKKHQLEYVIVFLVFVVLCLLPSIPHTSSKYVEKRTKKVTINAVQPTYTIIFDANGGSGEMENQVFTYMVAQNLHLNTFINEAGGFNGWNSKADGSGNSYDDGASIYNLTSTNGATITLYAQWIDKIARIGDVYYDTLIEAVAVANASSEQTEIFLLRNTNENIVIANGKSVILNLQGNTLGNVGNDNTIKNNGTFILRNGKVINNAETNGAINNYNTGTITIDGVDVTVYGTGNRQAFYNERGVATITGGSKLTSISNARPAVTNLSGGSMTINDATIISTVSSGLKNEGTLTIGNSGNPVNNNNPFIKGKTYGLETNKNVVFYDGILIGANKAVDNPNRLTSIPSGYMVVSNEEDINGVTYYEKYVGIGITITFNPNGGNIDSADRTKIIEAGKKIGILPNTTYQGKVFEGWYTEAEGGEEVLPTRIVEENTTFYAHWSGTTCVAKIGETIYDTLQEAFDAASDTELTNIELLKDTTEVLTVTSTKNIELDLGNNTISNFGNKAVITNNGFLSVSGGILTSNADTATINNLSGQLNLNDIQLLATGSRQTIYITSGEVNIGGDSYLSSKTTGVAATSPMQRGTVQCLTDGILNITGGTIVAENQHAVTNEGILTIGVKDGIVGTTVPTLIGKIDGIKSTGTINFYDGIIKGESIAIEGEVNDIEENTVLVNETEGNYKVAYLESTDNSNSVSPTLGLLQVNAVMSVEPLDEINTLENEEASDLIDEGNNDAVGEKLNSIASEDNIVNQELNDNSILDSNELDNSLITNEEIDNSNEDITLEESNEEENIVVNNNDVVESTNEIVNEANTPVIEEVHSEANVIIETNDLTESDE